MFDQRGLDSQSGCGFDHALHTLFLFVPYLTDDAGNSAVNTGRYVSHTIFRQKYDLGFDTGSLFHGNEPVVHHKKQPVLTVRHERPATAIEEPKGKVYTHAAELVQVDEERLVDIGQLLLQQVKTGLFFVFAFSRRQCATPPKSVFLLIRKSTKKYQERLRRTAAVR